MPETPQTPPPQCPWCPYTASLKQVLRHMETVHHEEWLELALSPLITGGVS
jgi:hypothetical protein